MTSTRTLNRQRKIDILKSVLNSTIDLLLLNNVVRDKINMSKFKELDNKVKEMVETSKPYIKIFTRTSKIPHGIPLARQRDFKGQEK